VVEFNPHDGAIRDYDLFDGVEGPRRLENAADTVGVHKVSVGEGVDRRPGVGVEREMVGEADQGVTAVAPVDSPVSNLGSRDVEAARRRLDACVGERVGPGEHPRSAVVTLDRVRPAAIGDRHASDDRGGCGRRCGHGCGYADGQDGCDGRER